MMSLLSDLDEAVMQAATSAGNDRKELLAEEGIRILEEYKKNLQSAGKSIIFAQFGMVQATMLPDNELRIICPSELTHTYIRDQRTDLQDYFKKETGLLVRITTEINEDEAIKEAQKVTVLSKSEIFDVMAAKNPSLGRLRDALGMQIEY